MASEYNEELFNKVVRACALDVDIKEFPAAELTGIGPRGINLSGGQKVRLAIARALYMQADVYLFDDILSAVDAQVERHLIENVLFENNIVGNKTCIL
ncbi:Canalicular multispecific organic anion transporter 1 [Coemansia sp. RSA 1721]|nr:Canalicular multispecific organic anion transporter 1 [Coemansia sp. RSA 1721]